MSNHEVDYSHNLVKRPDFKTLTVYGMFNDECRQLLLQDPDIHSLFLFGEGQIADTEIQLISESAERIDFLNIIWGRPKGIEWVHRLTNLRRLRLKFPKKAHDLSYIKWKESPNLTGLTTVNATISVGDLSFSNFEQVFIEDFSGKELTFKGLPNLALINCRGLRKVKTLSICSCPQLQAFSLVGAKSVSVVEADCTPKSLYLSRTSPVVAKALSSLRPQKLSLDGKWEYKSEAQAKIDFPNAGIEMF